MPVTVVPLTTPGFYYGPVAAVASLSSLWLRRESGESTAPIVATLYIDSVDSGYTLNIPSGQNEASAPLGVDISVGADVKVLVAGGNTAVVSGVLRTPSRLFRLAPSPLGKVWILSDGAWVAPPLPYVNDVGTWDAGQAGYRSEAGAWTAVI